MSKSDQSLKAVPLFLFNPGLLVVAFVLPGFVAALTAREASRCCRWASRNAAEMSRVWSVIDWRSRQSARSSWLPGVGLQGWSPLNARKLSMEHKLSTDLGLDFDTSLGSTC